MHGQTQSFGCTAGLETDLNDGLDHLSLCSSRMLRLTSVVSGFMAGSQGDHHGAACAQRVAQGAKPDISNEPEPDIRI